MTGDVDLDQVPLSKWVPACLSERGIGEKMRREKKGEPDLVYLQRAQIQRPILRRRRVFCVDFKPLFVPIEANPGSAVYDMQQVSLVCLPMTGTYNGLVLCLSVTTD